MDPRPAGWLPGGDDAKGDVASPAFVQVYLGGRNGDPIGVYPFDLDRKVSHQVAAIANGHFKENPLIDIGRPFALG